MRTTRRVVGTAVGLVLLTGAVSACEELESSLPQSSSSDAPAPTEAGQEPTPQISESADGASDSPSDQNAIEGEDPSTMEDDVPNVDPDAIVVDYETLPGDCHNDVPLPQTKHGVVSIENIAAGECLITIDSQGDSLFMVNDIATQLSEAGFQETSKSAEDNGPDALNTVSYLTNTHEVFVTVQQDGVSGVIISYALTDPARGNG